MAEYLHLFETEEEFQEARSDNYKEPWVSVTVENDNRVDFNKSEYEKLPETPLTFEITSNGNIKWTLYNPYNAPSTARTIEYKKNDGEWTSITATTGGTEIGVVSGDAVQFRGNVPTFGAGGPGIGVTNCFSGSTAEFNVKGNIMSLTDSEGFSTATTLSSGYTFLAFFGGCTGLTDASQIILPATTLANSCYQNMFQGCTNLTSAPALPATTLAEACYQNMFSGCTSLTKAPELPATTLAGHCYDSMFYGCTSLTQAPALPATTLASYCYGSMFQNCTSLTQAPSLPATTLANYCYNGMFQSCTSLTTAPELPATTLATYCYQNMFQGCTNLNYIKCLAKNLTAGTPPKIATASWVSGVQITSGTFIKNSRAPWERGINGIPDNWTAQDA